MKPQQRYWLIGAGGVAVVVLAIVVVFGITNPPSFPSLFDDGPTVTGTVAYVDYGRDDCVTVLDVGTGEGREVYCAHSVWLEGWDSDGNLRVQSAEEFDRVLVLDPDTGSVMTSGDFPGEPPYHPDSLNSYSHDGHAILVYTGAGEDITLIDVEGPRHYGFGMYGITADEQYAWVCDSEDRLLLVALDGSGGPWLVATGVPDAIWK